MLNKLRKALFQTDEPTVSEVDARIQETRARIAEYQARQAAIIEEIALTDGSTDKLSREHSDLAANIQGAETRLSLLAQERKAAVIRKTAVDYEARLRAISADYEQLAPAKARTNEAYRAYLTAGNDEQRLRSQITSAQYGMLDFERQASESGDIDRAELRRALNAVKAKYPAAQEAVGSTNQQARAMASIGFGTPAPEVEVKQ